MERAVNKGHGRLEIRWCWTISDPELLQALRGTKDWQQLQTVVKVQAKGDDEQQVTSKVRYYLSSLDGSPARLLAATHTYWGIENSLHSALDIAFREDECRVRKDHSAQNLATLGHIALNLVKQEKTATIGIKSKRLRAG
jgi:predicted transposase YbfD/YdcC